MANSVLASQSLTFNSTGSTQRARISSSADDVFNIESATGDTNLVMTYDGVSLWTISNVKDPAASSDAATKSYVDSVAQGLDVHESVRVATTAAGTLTTDFENGDTVDGVVLATGDRILIKNQAVASENGIYEVQATGAPVRVDDMSTGSSAAGSFTFVEEGTVNSDTGFVQTANAGSDVVGTDSLTFTAFSNSALSAGDGIDYTAGVLSVDSTVARTNAANTFTTGDQTIAANISLTGTTADNGYIQLAQTVAPTVVTDKLYNIGGALTWNGIDLTASSGSVNTGALNKVAYYAAAGTTVDDAADLTVNGTGLDVTGTVTASDFKSTSDRTFKDDIVTIDGALEKVKQMTGRYFTWKNDETKERQVGVIAQEMQNVMPEVVQYADSRAHLVVSYGQICAVLIEAVKELEARIPVAV